MCRWRGGTSVIPDHKTQDLEGIFYHYESNLQHPYYATSQSSKVASDKELNILLSNFSTLYLLNHKTNTFS